MITEIFAVHVINQKTDEFQKLEFWIELPVSLLPQEYCSRKDIHLACFENLADMLLPAWAVKAWSLDRMSSLSNDALIPEKFRVSWKGFPVGTLVR